MEQSDPLGSRRRDDPEFALREWGLKARISRENTLSRRFSSSHIRSFREDNSKSFRSHITISSTASSPGHMLREDINPSTYSFTNALKALQLRSINTWDCVSPDGFTLNSKWSEAEKYICNPLSGEFPMECLSAKTPSGRSFRSTTSGISMSAPLIYSSNSRLFHSSTVHQEKLHNILPIIEKNFEANYKTRDVGTQSSTPNDLTPRIPSPASTPSIQERSLKYNLKSTDSNYSSSKSKSEGEVEMKEPKLESEETKKKDGDDDGDGNKKKAEQRKYACSSMCKQGGCFLSLKNLWTRRRLREKHKTISNIEKSLSDTTNEVVLKNI